MAPAVAKRASSPGRTNPPRTARLSAGRDRPRFVLVLGRRTHFLGAERMSGPSFARGRREVDSVVFFELGMGARDHESGSGNESGSGSTFTGVSSDFDDSV